MPPLSPPTHPAAPPASRHRPFARHFVWLSVASLILQIIPVRVAAEERPLAAGMESTVPLLPGGPAMKVFLPSNYQPARTWPVVFFYHGAGGSPDTTWVRRLTDERDFIVAAMPYVAEGTSAGTPLERGDRLKSEHRAFQHALKWLAANARVDESSVFLAGISKGGWTAGSLWEMDPARVKGLIILLAGRQPGPSPESAAMRGRPVYIGAGETDPNLLAAMRARLHYRQCGALVCFDVFEGIGHQTPADPVRLRHWLRVHGLARQEDSDAAAFAEEFTAALAETDVLKQYRKLQLLSDDPRTPGADPAVLAAARVRFAELKQRSPAKEEWQAESRLGEILVLEGRIRSLAEMKTVLDGFQSIAQAYPGTRCGALAADHVPAVADAYAKSLEATRAANLVQGVSGVQKIVKVFEYID